MKKTTACLSITFPVILIAVLSPENADDRHHAEQKYKSPPVSSLNTQERPLPVKN
jgi:hypothetical protein